MRSRSSLPTPETMAVPTPETVATVRWAAQLGAITAPALAVRDRVSLAVAARRLSQAAAAGLLSRSRTLHAQPDLYTVTRAGLRVAGEPRLEPCRVRPGNALHLMACAAVAAALEHRHPDHRVEGERELRRAENDCGRPLASAVLGRGSDGELRLHRPDLVLWPRADGVTHGASVECGGPVAVEVELTVKAPRRLAELVRCWARCSLVDGVLYCAAPAALRAVERAVAGERAGDRILVVDLEGVVDPAPVPPPCRPKRGLASRDPSSTPKEAGWLSPASTG